MTDDQLDVLEVAANKMLTTSGGQFTSFYNEDFSKVILELIAELRQIKAEKNWMLDVIEKNRICCFTKDAEKYCQSHNNFCNECPYMGRKAWLKAIKEATCMFL